MIFRLFRSTLLRILSLSLFSFQSCNSLFSRCADADDACNRWCDREKGVAGMIAAQILPFGDPTVMGAWGACEKAVYDGLK